MRCDLHIHTVVSDGYLTPHEILEAAERIGLEQISITDHDTLGVYSVYGCDLVAEAAGRGVELVPGIELDSLFGDVEVHLLGYGLNPADPALCRRLEEIRVAREARIREQLLQVNAALGPPFIREDDIFTPQRRTYMKPHILRLLLSRKRFPDYKTASAWFRDNVRSSVQVPKFPVEEVIRWVIDAGGRAVLAHPGYYLLQHGLALEAILDRLVPAGLSGVETEYRYRFTSPHFPDLESERRMVSHIHEIARARGLEETRGSDAHSSKDLEDFNVF